MYANLPHILLGSLANAAAVISISPLCEGLIRKITARIQSRQGPPLLQPYYDLFKLLGKEDIESGQAPVVQRLAAYAAPAVVVLAATLLPLGFAPPMNRGADIILLIYVLSLTGVCVLLAGLAAGSTYSLIGTSREMMTMIPLEPLFAIALLVGAVHTGTLRLDPIFRGSVYHTSGAVSWSGLLLLIVVLLSFQGFVQRLPFDTTEAETEIMEGPLIEYSGPKLALLKLSHMARLVIHAALFVALFVPWGSSLPLAAAVPIFWFKVLIVVLIVTLIAATHARYRVDQAIRYFAVLLLLATGALVLACLGY